MPYLTSLHQPLASVTQWSEGDRMSLPKQGQDTVLPQKSPNFLKGAASPDLPFCLASTSVSSYLTQITVSRSLPNASPLTLTTAARHCLGLECPSLHSSPIKIKPFEAPSGGVSSRLPRPPPPSLSSLEEPQAGLPLSFFICRF